LLIKNKAAILGFGYFAVLAAVFGLFGERTFKQVYAFDGQAAEISGVITEKSEYSGDYASYTVKTEIDGVKTKVTLFATDSGDTANRGDRVTFTARLSRLRDNQAFPERAYNYSKGILLKADAVTPIAVIGRNSRKSPADLIRSYNRYVKAQITAAFPNDVGGLLCAVFLGDKSMLSDKLADNIKTAGASHFASVSGLHMTLIIHMLMAVIGLTPLRNRRIAKFVLFLFVIIGFMIFFDLSKSVLRAGVMLIVYYGAGLFYRKGSTLNSLGVALIVILTVEPLACLDAGLILSVSGTFGVGVVSGAVYKGRSEILRSLIASASATLCVLPAAAVYFKGISALSPITSLALTPFFMVAAASLTVLLVFAPLGFGGPFLFAAGLAAKAMLMIINLLGSAKAAYINLDYAFVPYWVGFAAIAVIVIRLCYKNAAETVKAGVLTVCALGVMICSYNYFAARRNYIEVRSDGEFGVIVLRRGGNSVSIPITGETSYRFGGYTIAVAQAKNEDPPPADLTVVFGRVKNKRETKSAYTVYISRRTEADGNNEINAYYDAAKFIIREGEQP